MILTAIIFFIYSMSKKHTKKIRNRYFVLLKVFVNLVFLRKSLAIPYQIISSVLETVSSWASTFGCFFSKIFCVNMLYDSIYMFVCLSKTLTGSEVKNTIVLFSQMRFCFVKIQNVLSNRANFLEKK